MRFGPLQPPHLLVAEEALLTRLADGARRHPTERLENRALPLRRFPQVQEGQVVRLDHVTLPKAYLLHYLHHSIRQE